MHVADCAPAILCRRVMERDASAAECIHASYSRHLRHEHRSWLLKLLAGMSVWPPYIFVGALRATWRNGAVIRCRTGKSIRRQLREQSALAFAYGIPSRWYYIFELFEDANRRRAAEYLQRGETKRGAYWVLKRRAGVSLSPLTDKIAFASRCRENGIRAVPVILALGPGGPGPGRLRLPPEDLFVKPNYGKGGRGAERWDYVGSDTYRDAYGAILTEGGLLRHLQELPLREGVIVQPRRVNHPALADVNNGALSTVRVVTCRNEQGRFEATNAVMRMAQGGNHVVDNFHAGGLAAAVDLASGTLGRATDLGISPHVGWRSTHPDSGAPIVGRQLPCWEETLALVVRAHAAFADRLLIGWDVGLMPDGPELVEGNGAPDLDIIQRTHRRPLGDARLGQLLAFHLRRSLENAAASSHVEAPPDDRRRAISR